MTVCWVTSVHPRWRGEHLIYFVQLSYQPGSSPLARGTRAATTAGSGNRRFIPAGAGNTRSYRRLAGLTTVHPRWRGEHGVGNHLCSEQAGSSPLARGTLGRAAGRLQHYRFIPAGAGNTLRRTKSRTRRSVHPRWRGEHPVSTAQQEALDGSSPLARGTPRRRLRRSSRSRFIPAGAGNTLLPLTGD